MYLLPLFLIRKVHTENLIKTAFALFFYDIKDIIIHKVRVTLRSFSLESLVSLLEGLVLSSVSLRTSRVRLRQAAATIAHCHYLRRRQLPRAALGKVVPNRFGIDVPCRPLWRG